MRTKRHLWPSPWSQRLSAWLSLLQRGLALCPLADNVSCPWRLGVGWETAVTHDPQAFSYLECCFSFHTYLLNISCGKALCRFCGRTEMYTNLLGPHMGI